MLANINIDRYGKGAYLKRFNLIQFQVGFLLRTRRRLSGRHVFCGFLYPLGLLNVYSQHLQGHRLPFGIGKSDVRKPPSEII